MVSIYDQYEELELTSCVDMTDWPSLTALSPWLSPAQYQLFDLLFQSWKARAVACAFAASMIAALTAFVFVLMDGSGTAFLATLGVTAFGFVVLVILVFYIFFERKTSGYWQRRYFQRKRQWAMMFLGNERRKHESRRFRFLQWIRGLGTTNESTSPEMENDMSMELHCRSFSVKPAPWFSTSCNDLLRLFQVILAFTELIITANLLPSKASSTKVNLLLFNSAVTPFAVLIIWIEFNGFANLIVTKNMFISAIVRYIPDLCLFLLSTGSLEFVIMVLWFCGFVALAEALTINQVRKELGIDFFDRKSFGVAVASTTIASMIWYQSLVSM